MSFRNVQGNNIPARTLRAVAPAQAAPWVRNPAWPALTAPTSGEQKLVGLYAVWPGDGVGNGGNFFAVNCAGNYAVSLGDGNSISTAANAQTNWEYNFANVNLYDATVTLTDAGDLVERPAHGYLNGMRVQFYRIVNTTGLVEAQFYYVVNATANNFQVASTVGGAALALTTNGSASLLPYKIATVEITPQAGQNLTAVNLFVKEQTPGLQGYNTGWLELAISGPNITSLTIGSSSLSLRHGDLESANIIELGAVTTFASLFQNCRKLQNVSINAPAAVTNMNSMFYSCSSLTTVPLFGTAAVTNMDSMFRDCPSLTTVPLFNTAAVTDMTAMFRDCPSLTTVPLFNTAAVTTMSNMFNNCPSITTVPLFNTAAVTVMGNMFNGCSSLTTIPLFNTAAVTNMLNMFNNCSSLTTVPALVTTAVTSANISGIFSGCVSLARIQAKNFRFSFSVSGCKLSAAALDEIYTNLPTVTAQTITVSNNYGTVGDNPAIATAKGWTVVG